MASFTTSKLHGIVKDFIQWSLELEMVTSDDQESLDRILLKCEEMDLIDRKDCGQCQEYLGEQSSHCTCFVTDPRGKYCPCFLRKTTT